MGRKQRYRCVLVDIRCSGRRPLQDIQWRWISRDALEPISGAYCTGHIIWQAIGEKKQTPSSKALCSAHNDDTNKTWEFCVDGKKLGLFHSFRHNRQTLPEVYNNNRLDFTATSTSHTQRKATTVLDFCCFISYILTPSEWHYINMHFLRFFALKCKFTDKYIIWTLS